MDRRAFSGARNRVRQMIGAGLTVALVAAGLVLTTAASASAAAPVLLSDDFEDGNAAGWRTSGGRWSVVEDEFNHVLKQGTAGAVTRARAGDPAWADYSVGVRVKALGSPGRQSAVSVLARLQSDGSHYYVATRPDDTVELGKVVGGRTIALATAAYPSYWEYWRSLTLVVKGSTLIGVINGMQLLRATDSQLTRGRAGLSTRYTSAEFDDVAVQSFAATAPDTQAPLTPDAPTAVNVTPTTATISWKPTIDNVGVVDYIVYQGDNFYSQYPVRTVAGTGPVTLSLSPTAASIHFAVAARDAAGNVSPISSRLTIPQPPSFPKTGDDTVAPTAPGSPRATGVTADGRSILSWTPATDNVGVVEYHVILVTNIDEVRLLAKVPGPSATVSVTGSYPMVRVIAYDAAWNSSSSPLVPYNGPGASPGPSNPVG